MMKKLLCIALFLSISAVTFAQKKPKIKGDRNVVEIENSITEEFNAIEIDDELSVEIIPSDAESFYRIKTDENLIDIVRFKVVDSILKIYTINRIVSSKKLEIELTAHNIEHIILKNDAKITSNGKLESKKLYLSCYNNSRFDLDIEADDVTVTLQRNAGGKLKVYSKNTTIIMNDRTDLKAYVSAKKITTTLNKTAELTLGGDAEYASYNLKDDSNLRAKDLKATSVDLYTSNNVDVYVRASKNLEVYAAGNSSIYLYGEPKVDVKGLTDSSKIIKR